MTLVDSTTWRVTVGGEETVAAWDPPLTQDSGVVFVCAHGAGGHMADRGLLQVTDVLRHHGLGVVRFNFLYRQQGSGRPDPMPRLLQCFSAVLARTRQELVPELLVIGGRSMGGRAASVLAAGGFPCAGLLLLAYPLHPSGRLEQLRDSHLPRITVPTLCFNGTRDQLCQRDLMEAVLARVGPQWVMHWLEGADHSFHVLKRSGRTDPAILEEIGAATAAWVADLRAARAAR